MRIFTLHSRCHPSRLALLLLLAATAAPPALPAQAAGSGVPVRYLEGSVHGFVEVRNDSGRILGYGDILQVAKTGSIESRMTLRFLDKSVFDETVTFTQHGVFSLRSYHLVQRGPAFEADLDATFAADGNYQVRRTSHADQREQHWGGQLKLPPDVSNGLVATLARNLHPGGTADVHVVAFTPKPQVVPVRIASSGTDPVTVGGASKPAQRFVVTPALGGVKGFLARHLGKLPAPTRIWILEGEVPAFVRFEGPLFTGPTWSLTLVAPEWPREEASPR